MASTILIVDDNVSIFHSLEINFQDFGFTCLWAQDQAQTLALLAKHKVEAVLLDLSLGKEDGLAILDIIKQLSPNLPVIMITGYGTLEKAVRAIKGGAYEFLAKPLDFRKLLETVQQAMEFGTVSPSAPQESQENDIDADYCGILTQSANMLSALRKAKLLARTDMPVLITGESGCGKELVANYIHTQSLRQDKPILRINCSAFPDSLIDNELFGHEKGAYTGADSAYQGVFEQAHLGTLHLDEIGDMILTSQAKLLRILEDGMVRRLGGRDAHRVDVRFIASTNQNLPEMIQERRFREDLFYRLKAAYVYLPPLRERKGDVAFIAEKLLAADGKTFSAKALEVLEEHTWPGNIRELRNTVKMCAVISAGEVVQAADIPALSGQVASTATVEQPRIKAQSLEEVEKEAIQKALEETRFNKRRASQRLGISYKTLYNKLKSYGLQ